MLEVIGEKLSGVRQVLRVRMLESSPLLVLFTTTATAGLIVGLATGAPLVRRELVRIDRPGWAGETAFAGQGVLYVAERVDLPAVYSAGGSKPTRIYETPAVPLPPRIKRQTAYESRVVQDLVSLDGSSVMAAFVRRVTVAQSPKCWPQCRLPGRGVRLFTEVRVRLGAGPFRRLAGGPGRCPSGQFWPDEVAVAGNHVVYSGRLDGCKGRRQESRIVVASVRGGKPVREVIAHFPPAPFTHVAAAGRFLAWTRDQGELPNSDLRNPRLVVYDRLRQRVDYRLKLPKRLRVKTILSLDVQSDGKAAAQIEREGGRCSIPQIIWSAPSARPLLHFIPGRSFAGTSTKVKLARDRLMFVWAGGRGCADYRASDLVVKSLNGAVVRVLGHYDVRTRPVSYPGFSFDFDGTRSAFAESVDLDPGNANRGWTSIYVDDLR